MTDEQIHQYLIAHNNKINAQDGLMDILNTSPQIIKTEYDFETRMITIITPNNKYIFEWVLREL